MGQDVPSVDETLRSIKKSRTVRGFWEKCYGCYATSQRDDAGWQVLCLPRWGSADELGDGLVTFDIRQAGGV